MAISDTKLRTIHGKPYSGPQEVADADGLSVRISPKEVVVVSEEVVEIRATPCDCEGDCKNGTAADRRGG